MEYGCGCMGEGEEKSVDVGLCVKDGGRVWLWLCG